MTDKQRMASIQGIKGVAACIVAFIWHYYHFGIIGDAQPFYYLFKWEYNYGGLMVEVFFMLSGFGMMMGYADAILEKKISFRDFITRRLRKIYPLHIITLFVVTILEALYLARTGETFVYQSYDVLHFFLNVLCMQTGIVTNECTFNGPAWCISVLVILYCMFYLVLYFSKSKEQVRIIFITLAVFGFVLVMHGIDLFFLKQTMARGIACFSLGVILYNIYEAKGNFNSNITGFFCLTLAISFFILFRLTEAASFGNIKIVFSFFVAPAIIIGVLFFKPIGAFLSLKPFKLIGNLSMLIYLLHFPVQCIIVLINEIFCLHINFASRITWALYVACIIFVVLIVDFFLVQIQRMNQNTEKNMKQIVKMPQKILIGITVCGGILILCYFGLFDRVIFYGMLNTSESIVEELEISISTEKLTVDGNNVSGIVTIVNYSSVDFLDLH